MQPAPALLALTLVTLGAAPAQADRPFHAVPCRLDGSGTFAAAYAVPLADLVEVTCRFSLDDDVAEPTDPGRTTATPGSAGVVAGTVTLPAGSDPWVCTSAWWAYRSTVGGGSGSDGPHCARTEPLPAPGTAGVATPCLFTTTNVSSTAHVRRGRLDAVGIVPGSRVVTMTCTVRDAVSKQVYVAAQAGPRPDFALVQSMVDVPADPVTEVCGLLTWRDADGATASYDAGCVPPN